MKTEHFHPAAAAPWEIQETDRRPVGNTAAAGTPASIPVVPSFAAPATSWSVRQTLSPGKQRVGPFGEIPALLMEHAVQPADVLRRAGLPPDALDNRDATIPFSGAGRLLAACAEATGRPDFGLLLASRWKLAHIGLVGELMRCSATVAQALDSFASIHWMNASGGAVFLRRQGDHTTMGYAIYEPGMQDGVREAYDYAVAVGVQMLRELTGARQWQPERVHLSRSRPVNVEPYQRFFGPRVRFNAEASVMQYPSGVDSIRLQSRDAARRRQLASMLVERREEVMPKLYRSARVAVYFGLSADGLARSMCMSHRTLNRRLLHAGLNVRDIFGSVRFEVSRQLLRDTSLSIGDIAGALGYSETSPFVRAFRRWSGTTPQSWREQVAAGQAAIVVTRDGSAGPSPRAEDASRRVGGETRQAEAA